MATFDPLVINKYLIIIVSLIGAFYEFHQAKKLKGSGYSWVKWGLGITLLFWVGYYFISVVNTTGSTHQVYVRTGILLTNALITAGAIISSRRLKQ